MKFVRIENGVVQEVIPEEANPIEFWYNAAFAEQCVKAPEEVEQNWIYNLQTGTFSPPKQENPEQSDRIYTGDELLAELLGDAFASKSAGIIEQ